MKDYFKDGRAYVSESVYAIVLAKRVVSDSFVNIVDKHEITVIQKEGKIDLANVIKIEKGWRIFTLDIVFSMDVYGVTAVIAGALADKKISIMPIAAYSRDHFLIKEKDVEKAKKIFEDLGIKIV